jgi:hypothetical protein
MAKYVDPRSEFAAMHAAALMRPLVFAAALIGVILALNSAAPPAQGQASFVQNGEAAFIVTRFDYALGDEANPSAACPHGLTQATRLDEALRSMRSLQGPARAAAFARLRTELIASSGPTCVHPDQAAPDEGQRMVEGGATIAAHGIDLDGQTARANGRAAPGTCAHDDFRGLDGVRGVDNQWFRVVGCSPRFQPDADPNHLTTEMLTGAWGVLITLKGVDDSRNDADVEVGFYASADPIQLSASRDAVPNVTYASVQDPRFRAVTHGRIVNGVLTSDPVDVRFQSTINGLRLERPLRDARVRMTLGADGVLDGYLAGYTPIEAMYDVQFGYRTAHDNTGALAPEEVRVETAIGGGLVFGYSCNGVYHAIAAAADAHRDPQTGRCTSISTQYRVRAIPAFMVDAETRSTNADLGTRATSNLP